MALGASCLRVTGEASHVSESHDVGMNEEPGSLEVTLGVVARVAVVLYLSAIVGFVTRSA